MKESMFYEKLKEGRVRCFLCAHRCLIGEGKRGICAVRENKDGVLYSLVYGKLIAMNIDPIEKKPLYHFLPGSRSFSIATVGCNFRCMHCQNYEISQFPRERPDVEIPGRQISPDELVRLAQAEGCQSISYTYTEPTIFLEYAYDCMTRARALGMKNVFVSNGFMTPESAGFIASFLDGNNIDLKGDDQFYRKVCRARLEPVKQTIRIMKEKGVWVEITTLIIPDYNDSPSSIRAIAEFISSVDPEIPWHVTQFYPTYKLTGKPRTPVQTLLLARKIGTEAGVKYVYTGNVPAQEAENTYCPACGMPLILRTGYLIRESLIKAGRCSKCGVSIAGVWAE